MTIKLEQPPQDDQRPSWAQWFLKLWYKVNEVANDAGNGGDAITELTGDVTASGPGSAVATIGSEVITDAKVAPGADIQQSKIEDLVDDLATIATEISDLQSDVADRVPIGVGDSQGKPTTQTISSAYPTYVDVSDMSVTFTTTRANQTILLIINLAILAGANSTAFPAYNVDGGSDVPMQPITPRDSGYGQCTMTKRLGIGSAGSHTIQVRACKGTDNFQILGINSNPEADSIIQAVLL